MNLTKKKLIKGIDDDKWTSFVKKSKEVDGLKAGEALSKVIKEYLKNNPTLKTVKIKKPQNKPVQGVDHLLWKRFVGHCIAKDVSVAQELNNLISKK